MKDMKKLIAIAVAAAALNASATVTDGMIDFENTTVWTGNIIDGDSLKPAQWFEANVAPFVQDMDQETAVMSYGGDVPKPEVDALDSSYNASGNSRYLAVDCVKPLLMETYANQVEGVTIDDGAYISMLAKFTPYDSLPDVAAGDKLHVWMASATNGTGGVTRQLVVTAAKIVGREVQRRDYAVTVDGVGGSDEWDGDTWHSVLFKVYKAVGSSGSSAVFPAVVVFVDGKVATIKGVLSYDANKMIQIDSTDLSVGDADFQALVTDDALAAKLGANQLFPSLVTQTQNKTSEYVHNKIRHIAFLGTGSIDNIRIDSSDPLVESYSAATITVSAPAGVTCSPASASNVAPGGSATFTITPPTGGTITKIMLGATDVTDLYHNGSITVTLPDPLTASSYVLTVTAGGIVATVNGVAYDNLQDALDASADSAGAGDYPAVLGKDLEWENNGESAVYIQSGQVATLDLNGHTIEVTAGANTDEWTAYITCAGSLTVIDSSVAQTGKMIAPVGDDAGMYVLASEDPGEITVLGGTFEGGFDLELYGTYSLAGGKYLSTFFGASEFDMEASLAYGFAATLSGGYWTVAPDSTGDEYPSYIDTTNPAMVGRYNMWKDQYGADTASAYETAFLLNIAPDATDQTLEPVEIIVVGGKVVIKANQTLMGINGKVYIKTATTPGGLASAEWSEADIDAGDVQVTPGAGDEAGFYKIKVGF